jgi:glycosyltransferase involved in cell wall biosynthesis
MLLVKPGDVNALVENVLRVARNANLKRQLSLGAESLGKQFDWTEIASETEKVYRRGTIWNSEIVTD